MQNPLDNDVQYQAANYSTEFAPVDIVDLVPEIEKENKRQSDAFDKRIASQKANDQRRITIAEQPSALEELGKFSETLTKSLVDVQDKRNKAIIEVNVRRYLKFQKTNYTDTAVIDWVIKGPVENSVKSSYIQFGAKAINKETVEKASEKIKELPQMIKNYGEFVV